MTTDTISPVIQIVALFLPAWAVMVQIFARLMEKADIGENPAMIPFFGVGLSLTVISVWMFGRSISGVVLVYMVEESQAVDPLLLQSLSDIMHGGLAFLLLGVIVLALALIKNFDFLDSLHIFLIIALSMAIMNFIDGENIARIVWIHGLLILLDLIISVEYWESLKYRIQESTNPGTSQS